MDKNELRCEDLQYKGLKIYQHKDLYCFTSDSVMLANFANIKKSDNVCEFCAGGGVISILISAKHSPRRIEAVEIQKEMFEMMEINIAENNIQNIQAIHDDIKNYCKTVRSGSCDVVVCNPPYKKKNVKIIPQNDVKAIARHEILLDLKQLIACTNKILKFGGKFYVCYDANRSAELIYEMANVGIEAKRMFFTQPSQAKNATLVFIEAVKGGKPGVVVLPTLITNDLDGKYVQNIFDNYRRS